MILTLLILSVGAFITYFYIIGLRYLGILPLLVLLIFIVYYISGISLKSKANSLLQDYGLFFAWVVIMLGLFLIFQFFGIGPTNSFLFLVTLNFVFLIGSYFFNYQDGRVISWIGYYFAILGLLINARISGGFDIFLLSFTYMCLLSLAVTGFVTFLLGLKYKIDKIIHYKLLTFLIISLALLFYYRIQDIYIYLIMSVLALAALYIYIYHVLSKKPPTESEIKEISVRRILAGERVLKTINKDHTTLKQIYQYIYDIPSPVKYFLETLNTLIILILIYLYIQNALSLKGSIEQLFYRIIMVGFIVNVFLLKRINYTSTFQRLLTFMVINFAIYISLFSALNGDIGSIVFLGILWNIMSTMMVFHIHKTKLGQYLRKIDYLFWIFTTMLALVVNIVLLFNTEIARQLLFPIILLYVGVQGMMLYYSVKYINKIKEVLVDEDEII